MRDYLYLWHRPATRDLILSGVEFRDFVPELSAAGGVVLLRHAFDAAIDDRPTRFEYVPSDRLQELAKDDVYGYGDFAWCDFGGDTKLSALSDESVAEMTFFAHAGRPLRSAAIAGLDNRFLCWAHDDGWYARLCYRDWSDVEPLIVRLLRVTAGEHAASAFESIRTHDRAIWCREGNVAEVEGTEDIDSMLDRYLHGPTLPGRRVPRSH